MRLAIWPRIAGAVAALAVAAWFALGVRQSQALDAATALIASGHGRLAPAVARRARHLLDVAAALDPDRAVDLERSALALRQGQPARARAIALSVARAEPQNLQAWIAYGTASADDPAAFRLALRRLEQLAPTVR
ncbi:MAG TPA: hypothetical protein VKV27_16355 [Solirubrobacteraceae bacterium]|nr:hypothetical protein [Solirubrobacteraceae bacterium]